MTVLHYIVNVTETFLSQAFFTPLAIHKTNKVSLLQGGYFDEFPHIEKTQYGTHVVNRISRLGDNARHNQCVTCLSTYEQRVGPLESFDYVTVLVA